MPENLGFMLNDHLGDCPIAGLHHGRQILSFNTTGDEITDPDAAVLADYERICRYVDGDPSTDNGGVLQDVLTQAVQTGITTDGGYHRLLGFYEIDPRNLHDICRAIAESGFAYIGIAIPDAWSDAVPGGVWDATEPGHEGHCVLLTGYELGPDHLPVSFDVSSWGLPFTMTREGFVATCDEAYALVDPGWTKATGLTPAGLSLAQIEADMAAVKAA